MGKLIVLEGIDGAGKTTIANRLALKLSENYDAVFLDKKSIDCSSNYVRKFMENIKKSLWQSKINDPVEKIDEETWLYLHVLWYRLMQEHVIKEKLGKHDYVILDGWIYKFWARHYCNGDFDFEYSENILKRLRQADRVFLLDVSPEESYVRKKEIKRSELGAHGMIEGKDKKEQFINYQEKMRGEYLKFADEYSFEIIQAQDSIENIINQILCKI